MPPPPPPLLFLYGSQTGNAREIASLLHGDAAEHGLGDARIYDLNTYLIKDPSLAAMRGQGTGADAAIVAVAPQLKAAGDDTKPKQTDDHRSPPAVVVLVVSTTGQGDPPDNTRRFMRFLKRMAGPSTANGKTKQKPFDGVRYALLALGSSDYDNFCAAGRAIDKFMGRAGAEKIYPTGLADDATGLSDVVEPWRKGLWPALRATMAPSAHGERVEAAPTAALVVSAHGEPAIHPVHVSSCGLSFSLSQDIVGGLRIVAAPWLARQGEESTVYEDMPKLKVEKPKGLVRFKKPIHRVVYAKGPLETRDFLMWRWQRFVNRFDSENALSGYTPESPFLGILRSARYLTRKDAEDRCVVEMDFDLPSGGDEDDKQTSSSQVLYSPGDAIGIYCPNPIEEVQRLLSRLGVSDENARRPMQLVQDTTKHKKKKKEKNWSATPEETMPLSHIPQGCSLHEALVYCVDITLRGTGGMRKVVLRACAEYCNDPVERAALYELASPVGKDQYRTLRDRRPSMWDVLQLFPSCAPPVAMILELLPPLTARYYSATSSALTHPESISVAFTLVEFDAPLVPDTPRRVHGVCTQWLHRLAVAGGKLPERCGGAAAPGARAQVDCAALQCLPGHVARCARGSSATVGVAEIAVPMFIRRSMDFTVPEDPTRPLILVGVGTGVAPFRAFLQHIRSQRDADASGGTCAGWWRGLDVVERDEAGCAPLNRGACQEDESEEPKVHDPVPSHASAVPESVTLGSLSMRAKEPTAGFGPVSLYFGCRHREHDFLYQEDLKLFVEDGTLQQLHVAFSRERPQGEKVYVQHLMKQHAAAIGRSLMEEDASIFVCGDGTTMLKCVQAAVTDIVATHLGGNKPMASRCMQQLMREKRYVADIWSE